MSINYELVYEIIVFFLSREKSDWCFDFFIIFREYFFTFFSFIQFRNLKNGFKLSFVYTQKAHELS